MHIKKHRFQERIKGALVKSQASATISLSLCLMFSLLSQKKPRKINLFSQISLSVAVVMKMQHDMNSVTRFSELF